MIERDLTSKEEMVFIRASGAAQQFGIDTWNLHWERLHENPLESFRWFHVIRRTNQERIDPVMDLAVRTLPLEQIATGPSNEMIYGEKFQLFQSVEQIVQELHRFPGKGAPLIFASLKSPSTRGRNLAIKALREWGVEHWPEGTKQALEEALALEPNDDVKERIEQLLEKTRE